MPRLVQTPWPQPPATFFQSVYTTVSTLIEVHHGMPTSPCFLPILFNVFMRKEYTTSAFERICQYVDLGFFACDSAIAIGMVPLLLQSLLKAECLHHTVFCLTKIVSYDVWKLKQIIRESVTTSEGTASPRQRQ